MSDPSPDRTLVTDPARRVLAIGATQTPDGKPVGTTQIFGITFTTTHLLGYTSDGMDGETERAFPGWITLPGYQDLAGGRDPHQLGACPPGAPHAPFGVDGQPVRDPGGHRPIGKDFPL